MTSGNMAYLFASISAVEGGAVLLLPLSMPSPHHAALQQPLVGVVKYGVTYT